jgi:uncharacterized protein YjbI with pentapeptide repeats
MSRRGRSGYEPPRVPSEPDLPADLRRANASFGELRASELREQHISGVDLSSRDATATEIVESRLEDVDLSDATLRRASIRDAVFNGGSWANVDASEAMLARVE